MKQRIFLALLPMFVVALPVRAVEPGRVSNRNEVKIQQNQPDSAVTTLKQVREETRTAKCELSETKMNFRINQYEQSRDKHTSIFNGISKHLAEIIGKYESNGCDVTTLKTDLTKFNTLIEDFGTSFRDFVGSMQNTRNFQCGDSQGKYVNAVKTSQTKLTVVKQKSEAVRTFFKSTIKPHLSQKIKECRSTPKPTSSPKE